MISSMKHLSNRLPSSRPTAPAARLPSTRAPAVRNVSVIQPHNYRTIEASIDSWSSDEDEGVGAPRRVSLLSRISAAVELQAAIQKFETIAGRSAMLGFFALLLGETVGNAPVIQGDVQVVAASLLLAMTTAVILAFTRRRLGGGLLLEAVTASLTSAQRSASSLTTISCAPGSFDSAVDRVVGLAFDTKLEEFFGYSAEEAQ